MVKQNQMIFNRSKKNELLLCVKKKLSEMIEPFWML